jgi:hypothetical protein
MTKSKVVAKAAGKANLLLGKGNPPKEGDQ